MNLSPETMAIKKSGITSIRGWEKKNCQPRILYPVSVSLKNKGESKISDEAKLREFVAIGPFLFQRWTNIFFIKL